WGVIDALGEDVDDVEIGQRVAVLSANAYAEFDLASRDCVVALPDALDGQPFPGEPLGCVMNIFARSDIQAGQSVAIVGAGFLGVLLTQLASRAGAQVVVISRRNCALDQAKRMGAAETLSSEDPNEAREQALSFTAGRGYD